MRNSTQAVGFPKTLGSEERPLRACSEDVLPRDKELLGEGAFGYVVAAQMSMFGEKAVAVKVSKTAWNAALFDEICSMLLVQDRGTCPEVLGVMTGATGIPAMVWSMDDGGDVKRGYVQIVGFVMAKATACLIDVGKEEPWEYPCLVSMFLKMAYRIRELQAAGILHLDIKPENFLVTDVIQSDGSMSRLIQVSDFGMAKPLTNGKCVCRSACGTPGYQAPEVARATHLGVEVDCKADIFSLGATFFALTGSAQCQELLRHCPGADTVMQLISDCMNEDPDARPPMTEVIAVLERVRELCQSMAEEEGADGESAEWQSDKEETEPVQATAAAGTGSGVSPARLEGAQSQSQPPPPPYEEAHLYPTLYVGAEVSIGTVRSSPPAIQVSPTCEDTPLSPVKDLGASDTEAGICIHTPCAEPDIISFDLVSQSSSNSQNLSLWPQGSGIELAAICSQEPSLLAAIPACSGSSAGDGCDCCAYLSVCHPAGSIAAPFGCAGVSCAHECRTSRLPSLASSDTLTVLGSSAGGAEPSASHTPKPASGCKASEDQSAWHKLCRASKGLWRRMVRLL